MISRASSRRGRQVYPERTPKGHLCKRVFISTTTIDHRNRARNREHFFPFGLQAPVSHGGRFANPAQVLLRGFDARFESGENFLRVLWRGRIKIRLGGVELLQLRKS